MTKEIEMKLESIFSNISKDDGSSDFDDDSKNGDD
jgi:hypothetical protein